MERNHMNTLKKCWILFLSLAIILTQLPTGMVVYALDDTGQPEAEQQTEASVPGEEVMAEAPAPGEAFSETPASEEAFSEAPAPEEIVSEDTSDSDEESENTSAPAGDEVRTDEQTEAEEARPAPKTAEEEGEGSVNEEAAAKELTAGNNRYEITVSYDAAAEIPDGASLVLTEYGKDDEKFTAARNALTADENGNSAFSQTTEKDQEGLGMAAFDLTIYDRDGNASEPKSKVRVSFTLKELPEGADAKALARSMEIQHLNESSGNTAVEKIATFDSEEAKGNDAVAEIRFNETEGTIKAETVVDGFSTYALII